MRPAARRLAAGLERCIALQERLVEMASAQRASLVGGLHDSIDASVRAAEATVLELSVAEAERQTAAEELADELGVAATRWSALRPALSPAERDLLGPLVDRVETVVRDLELANAINSQVVMRELDLVDVQIRGLSSSEAPRVTRGYSDDGSATVGQGAAAMLLNTSA